MPRRNNRPKSRTPLHLLEPTDERPPTCDQMARDLVSRGLASPLILGPRPAGRKPASKADHDDA